MSGSRWGSWRRDGACPPASSTPESPWAALDRRRVGPRRLPLLLLTLAAVAVLVVGVAVFGGPQVVSHGGLVSVANDDDQDSGDQGSRDDAGSNGGEESGSDSGSGSRSGSGGGSGSRGGSGSNGGAGGGSAGAEDTASRCSTGGGASTGSAGDGSGSSGSGSGGSGSGGSGSGGSGSGGSGGGSGSGSGGSGGSGSGGSSGGSGSSGSGSSFSSGSSSSRSDSTGSDSGSGSRSGSGGSGSGSSSGDDSSGNGGGSGGGSGSSGSGSGGSGGSGGGSGGGSRGGSGGAGGQGGARGGGAGAEGGQEFPNRDKIGRACVQEYVDAGQARSFRSPGQGGVFSGGSYTIRCGMSSHHNSDNPIITPGVRNGAQHTHDYAGNEGTNFASVDETLEESSTTCTNGDRHPIFWPVLRDLRGQGPDVGADGGSLDGNVGSFVEPSSVDVTFHGHGTRRAEAMPLNIALVSGSAKAGTTGEGVNAKYTCSGAGGQMTDLYPMCPPGSALQRVFDFPSCWNGQDLDSERHDTHIVFPDEDGECPQDLIPVPALRITVNYDDPPPGRQFAIDSFPEQQHNPITDHALLEYLSSERRAQEGVECINAARRCTQGPEQDAGATGSTDAADQVPRSQTFAHAMATHATHGATPAAATQDGAHALAGASHHQAFPGATGPAAHAAPATMPEPTPTVLAPHDPSVTLGPLPGLAPLPVLAAPLAARGA